MTFRGSVGEGLGVYVALSVLNRSLFGERALICVAALIDVLLSLLPFVSRRVYNDGPQKGRKLLKRQCREYGLRT